MAFFYISLFAIYLDRNDDNQKNIILSFTVMRPWCPFRSSIHFRSTVFTLISWNFSWFCHLNVVDRLAPSLNCNIIVTFVNFILM